MVTVILVRGADDNFVDRVIQQFSDGPYSHSAIKFPWALVESMGIKAEEDIYPGVWPHEPGTYDNAIAARAVIDLPDQEGAEREARRLIGRPYGYLDCLKGGLHDTLGIDLPGNKLAMNCSETVTRILRAGGFNVCPGVEPDCVTPNDLYRALESMGYFGR